MTRAHWLVVVLIPVFWLVAYFGFKSVFDARVPEWVESEQNQDTEDSDIDSIVIRDSLKLKGSALSIYNEADGQYRQIVADVTRLPAPVTFRVNREYDTGDTRPVFRPLERSQDGRYIFFFEVLATNDVIRDNGLILDIENLGSGLRYTTRDELMALDGCVDLRQNYDGNERFVTGYEYYGFPNCDEDYNVTELGRLYERDTVTETYAVVVDDLRALPSPVEIDVDSYKQRHLPVAWSGDGRFIIFGTEGWEGWNVFNPYYLDLQDKDAGFKEIIHGWYSSANEAGTKILGFDDYDNPGSILILNADMAGIQPTAAITKIFTAATTETFMFPSGFGDMPDVEWVDNDTIRVRTVNRKDLEACIAADEGGCMNPESPAMQTLESKIRTQEIDV